MRLAVLRRCLGIFLLLISLVILIWGAWPARVDRHLVGSTGDASQPGLWSSLGVNTLQVSWPAWIQVGRIGKIELILSVDGPVTAGQDGLQLQARLDLPGATYIPAGSIRQSARSGIPVRFHWQFRMQDKGNQRGMLWLHLLQSSQAGGGDARQRLILAQPLEIHSGRLLGLDAYRAQIVGLIGIIIGAALLSDVIGSLAQRVKKWS